MNRDYGITVRENRHDSLSLNLLSTHFSKEVFKTASGIIQGERSAGRLAETKPGQRSSHEKRGWKRAAGGTKLSNAYYQL